MRLIYQLFPFSNKQVGIMLKPFLPQLQTTFVKALNDPTQAVREKAAWALGLLTVLHTRVDSLFTELKNGIRNNEDNGIRYDFHEIPHIHISSTVDSLVEEYFHFSVHIAMK